ncbi:MAG: hypothetical protein GQ535_03565 [Rhodobacteraceae bacterium]|nr:hypothetical protein [Paracoccaceae bacterium]
MGDTCSSRTKRLAYLRNGALRTMSRIHLAFPDEAAAITIWRKELPVCLVMGAPRGGTSAFKGALARHSDTLAMPGEHRLFFTLAEQNFPDGRSLNEAMQAPPDSETQSQILDLILTCSFSGPEITRPDSREIERYALDWAMRLPLQWTSYDIDPEQVTTIVTNATARYLASGVDDLIQLDQEVLAALQEGYPFIRAGLYDGAKDTGGINWVNVRNDISPIVEITPFVLPRPRQLKHSKTRASVLLLKASSDPFRIPSLRALFEGRPMTMLRLTRNPLASVNGLLDGWAYPAFWQHDLRAHSYMPDTLKGWCFDLYPGWRDATQLSEVTVDQWRIPNEILQKAETAPAGNETWHSFAFEAFQSGTAGRTEMLCNAAIAMGLDPMEPQFAAAIAAPRQVNATVSPCAARWKQSRPELRTLATQPEISQLAKSMGYNCGDIDAWI